MSVAVVDYGRGNLFSINRALHAIGVESFSTDNPEQLSSAEQLVLPGVGAFGDAMAGLRERNLVEPLIELAKTGKPICGICVGYQLFMEGSDEFGANTGLGLLKGWVRRLPEDTGSETGTRIPNVGWRRLIVNPKNDFFHARMDQDLVYFTHSFAPSLEHEGSVSATIEVNDAMIDASAAEGNLVGFQFHPEKSGPTGLKILEQFLAWTR